MKDEWGNIVSESEYYGSGSDYYSSKDEWGNIIERSNDGYIRERNDDGDYVYKNDN